jgi:hypothetical protein|tara:strand:+ start:104 stop:538 length:435 start_codon:yes stop_codon:yes gene_type:complete
MAKIFENVCCSRCGGTGHYSFNQADGSTCFKCKGSKTFLTPRGRAAQDYYTSLITVPAQSVRVGDVIFPMSYEKRGVVTKVLTASEDKELLHLYVNGCSYGMGKTCTVKLALVGDERQVNINKALAFQDKLTKAGKLMKKYQLS